MKNKIQLIALLFFVGIQIGCVQETREITVTFEVDMTGINQVSSVSIIGELPPLSWRKQKALRDVNGDGVFETTLTFDIPYDAIDYKYVLNGKKTELKGKANRRVFVKHKNKTTVRSLFDQQSYEDINSLSTR